MEDKNVNIIERNRKRFKMFFIIYFLAAILIEIISQVDIRLDSLTSWLIYICVLLCVAEIIISYIYLIKLLISIHSNAFSRWIALRIIFSLIIPFVYWVIAYGAFKDSKNIINQSKETMPDVAPASFEPEPIPENETHEEEIARIEREYLKVDNVKYDAPYLNKKK